jgi:hypothetical protein
MGLTNDGSEKHQDMAIFAVFPIPQYPKTHYSTIPIFHYSINIEYDRYG